MKKLILFFFLLSATVVSLTAQQDVNYTHFMFNRLAFNPAYAGSNETMTIGALYRHQWDGVAGAPKTFTAFAHTPFMNGRGGAGLGITSDRIGMLSTQYIDLSYAYKIPTGDYGVLSIGVLGRLEMSNIDWTSAKTLQEDDEVIMMQDEGRNTVNFGTGVYYQNRRFHVGLSAPSLLRSTLYRPGEFGAQDVLRQRSYYFVTGYNASLSENVAFQPNVMLTFNPNTAFEADFNANFVFFDTFLAGVSYRLGDSFDALFQYKIAPEFKAGFAFDFTSTEMNEYSNATFEVMLEYMFNYQTDGTDHIRFF